MRFLTSASHGLAVGCLLLLATSSLAAEPDKTGRGRLISFQEGKLTLKARDGSTLVYDQIATRAAAVRFDAAEAKFVPAEPAAALSEAKTGDWIQVIVDKGKITLRVGERKQQTVGTFVSFKDQRLMLLLKVTGPSSYVKKYGNLIHFNKFFADTPVEESVDGEEYKRIGTADKVLAEVKEGTVLTIHSQGDDNTTLIQIGTPKKPK